MGFTKPIKQILLSYQDTFYVFKRYIDCQIDFWGKFIQQARPKSNHVGFIKSKIL